MFSTWWGLQLLFQWSDIVCYVWQRMSVLKPVCPFQFSLLGENFPPALWSLRVKKFHSATCPVHSCCSKIQEIHKTTVLFLCLSPLFLFFMNLLLFSFYLFTLSVTRIRLGLLLHAAQVGDFFCLVWFISSPTHFLCCQGGKGLFCSF